MSKMDRKSAGKEEIKIELIRPEESEQIYEFALEHFYKDEPLCNSMGVTKCEDLRKFCLKSLNDNCSFKAVNSKGELVGIRINGITRKPAEGKQSPVALAEQYKDPNFKKIVQLVDYIDRNCDVFAMYPEVTCILDAVLLAVDRSYRGLGIGGLLVDRTLEYMRAHQIPLIKVICSSLYSYRVMQNLGFDEIFTVPYAQYKANGEPIFKPEAKHVACRVMLKDINKN